MIFPPSDAAAFRVMGPVLCKAIPELEPANFGLNIDGVFCYINDNGYEYPVSGFADDEIRSEWLAAAFGLAVVWLAKRGLGMSVHVGNDGTFVRCVCGLGASHSGLALGSVEAAYRAVAAAVGVEWRGE